MPITFARDQTANGDGADPTATFGATPTEGDLLVTLAFSRSGTSTSSLSISGSGWTKRIGRDTELGNASARRSLTVWTKVAGSSEPTGITVSGDTVRLLTAEYSAGVSSPTWTFEQSADNDNGTTTNATSLATGTTASVGAGDLLLVPVLGIRANSGVPITDLSWTTAGSALLVDGSGSGQRTVGTGFVQQSASGTKADTANWLSDNTGASAGIIVFSATEAAGGVTTEQVATAIAMQTASGGMAGLRWL